MVPHAYREMAATVAEFLYRGDHLYSLPLPQLLNERCPICLEPYDATTVPYQVAGTSGCTHIFCLACIHTHAIEHQNRCPMCRAIWYRDTPLDDMSHEEEPRLGDFPVNTQPNGLQGPMEPGDVGAFNRPRRASDMQPAVPSPAWLERVRVSNSAPPHNPHASPLEYLASMIQTQQSHWRSLARAQRVSVQPSLDTTRMPQRRASNSTLRLPDTMQNLMITQRRPSYSLQHTTQSGRLSRGMFVPREAVIRRQREEAVNALAPNIERLFFRDRTGGAEVARRIAEYWLDGSELTPEQRANYGAPRYTEGHLIRIRRQMTTAPNVVAVRETRGVLEVSDEVDVAKDDETEDTELPEWYQDD